MSSKNWETIQQAGAARLRERGLSEDLIEEFEYRVRRIFDGDTGLIPWSAIGDLSPTDYVKLEDLFPSDSGATGAATKAPAGDLSRLVVIKLNGGLGTSMGLARAKSLMPVKAGLSFLDVILMQTRRLRKKTGAGLPLLFMNSFNTQKDTLQSPGVADINAHLPGNFPADFLQNMVPRIDSETLLPIGDGKDNEHWCPPGHGDIFLAMRITGLLDRLLTAGFKTAFLSNGDNLGATVEPGIVSYFEREGLDFMSEVTPKTRADLKGGVLYRTLDSAGAPGPIELLETAQVEPEHLADFQDVARFAYFNINNLWVNLESLRDRLNRGGFHLSLIRNPKEVAGQKVLQLETAMGAAIGKFERTRVLVVPRTRFAPVKTTGDLMVRRSDCYTLLEEDGALIMNPNRTLGEPVVTLDDAYKKIGDFEKLVPVVPSLVGASELTVKGRVIFDAPVAIVGRVSFQNAGTKAAALSALGRTQFENEDVRLS